MLIDVTRVDGEWMVAKKDWQEAEKRYKSQEKQRASLGKNGRKSNSAPTIPVSTPEEDETPAYDPDMDDMRCILYTHGGKPADGPIILYSEHQQAVIISAVWTRSVMRFNGLRAKSMAVCLVCASMSSI